MLTWEREQVGLAIEEVAQHLKVSPQEVLSWETGEEQPRLADLRRLADMYFCPVGHFFLEAPLPMEQNLDFRGLASDKIPSYRTQRRLRQFLRLLEIVSEWRGRVAIPAEPRLPLVETAQPSDAATAIREFLGVDSSLRQTWESADEAFAGWRAAVEQCNVFVLSLSLPLGEARGASVWPSEGLPGILVNHSDMEASTGRIFTLLHEFVHLLMKSNGLVCDFRGQQGVEGLANRIAAHTIVPEIELESHLSDLGLDTYKESWAEDELDTIRKPFQASRDTIAISLEHLGLSRPGYYDRLRAAWDKRRPRGRKGTSRLRVGQVKPKRRVRELGALMSNLVLSAADNESVSRLDVAEVLDMPLYRLSEFAEAVGEG